MFVPIFLPRDFAEFRFSVTWLVLDSLWRCPASSTDGEFLFAVGKNANEQNNLADSEPARLKSMRDECDRLRLKYRQSN